MRQHWRFWTFITLVVVAGCFLVPGFLTHQRQVQDAQDSMTIIELQHDELVREGLLPE